MAKVDRPQYTAGIPGSRTSAALWVGQACTWSRALHSNYSETPKMLGAFLLVSLPKHLALLISNKTQGWSRFTQEIFTEHKSHPARNRISPVPPRSAHGKTERDGVSEAVRTCRILRCFESVVEQRRFFFGLKTIIILQNRAHLFWNNLKSTFLNASRPSRPVPKNFRLNF